MFGKKKKNIEVSKAKKEIVTEVKTIIGSDCQVTGNIITKSSLKTDGQVNGNIAIKGNLIVGEKGNVVGDVECEKLTLLGRVEGNVKAVSLELKKTGYLKGKISTVELQIESGGIYLGEVDMQLASNASKRLDTEEFDSIIQQAKEAELQKTSIIQQARDAELQKNSFSSQANVNESTKINTFGSSTVVPPKSSTI